jgi:hypothetical protein
MAGVGARRKPPERAVVTYPAPHGIDALTLSEGETVTFGRSADCEARFGYAPVPDNGVPRVAGRLLVAGDRVFLESVSQPGHRALEVRGTEGTSVQIPHGEGFSPRERQFDILVRGESNVWKLGVTVRVPFDASTVGAGDPPTNRFDLGLSHLQEKVLAAYCEPLTMGRIEPATHKEVAAALNYHPNTVREVLYEIWALMFAHEVPMPDVSDKRVAVAEAARVHGLLWTST